ncbi:MAG: DegV family protein [Chloroflexota bacterium]
MTDSTADLPPQRTRDLHITVIPLTVNIDGASFQDGIDLPPSAFYEKLVTAKTIPSTSQPSVGAFLAAYRAIDASDIISIHISGGLSGTINSAQAAAAQVPDKRIAIIDSRTVSLAMGYLAQVAAQAAENGATFEEVRSLMGRSAGRTGFFAILDTLGFARRSGRLGFAQALVGTMLQVKPIISMVDGLVQPVERPRTIARAVDKLVEITARQAPFASLAVPHANNEDLAREVADRLSGAHAGDIDIVTTGAVVGSHCGPGAVATCFLKA